MSSIIATSVMAAGLVFSLSVALLIEELIFGAIFRLFFRRSEQAVAATAVGSAGFEPVKQPGGGR
ncbi:MAG TPA: hypothetical protein VE998_07915 [Terriglobales bacterium]|nr:hypothetical protein [Terriglobales bacterium]